MRNNRHHWVPRCNETNWSWMIWLQFSGTFDRVSQQLSLCEAASGLNDNYTDLMTLLGIHQSFYSPRLLSFRKLSFTSQNISSDVLYMQQRSLWYHFSNFQHFREQKYWWQVWLLCGSASEWASLFCLTRYGHTALALRPDVLNAEYHVKTNATYSCHNHTLYQQSSNMSRILKLVRYYAVIISPYGKFPCKHGAKRCSLLWQKRQNSRKISMDRLIKVDGKLRWVI